MIVIGREREGGKLILSISEDCHFSGLNIILGDILQDKGRVGEGKKMDTIIRYSLTTERRLTVKQYREEKTVVAGIKALSHHHQRDHRTCCRE